MIWMMLWLGIGTGLFVALLWGLFRAVRRGEIDQSPEAILKRRYAAGEMDTEEFERRLAAVRKTRDAA